MSERRWRGRVGRLGALVALSLGLVVLLATPAFAHATLLQTTPGAGQVLTSSPRTIQLRYNESVEVDAGAVRMFDQKGDRVDTGPPSASGDVVRVAVREKLGDGLYVVTWRVTSADSHPVQGAFAFQVGTAANATSPAVSSLENRLLDQQSSDHVVGALYGVDRGVLFAGVALLLGATAFATLVWPASVTLRRTVRIAELGWAATAVATACGILLQGPYAAALPLSDALEADVLRDVVDSRYGHLALARLALLLLAIPVMRVLFRRTEHDGPRPRWWTPGALLVSIGIALTISLAGHAHTGDYTGIAVPADVLHLLAMSAWIGGLVVLTVAVFPGRDVAQLRDAVPRFSRIGFWSVCVLVVTGTFQGWRQVRSLDALRNTDYGQLLIIKLAIVAVILVFAARSRQLRHWLWPEPEPEPHRELVVAGGSDDDPAGPIAAGATDGVGEEPDGDEARELRHLRGSVFAEVLGAIAVIVVTALLVNAVPANVAAGRQIAGATAVTLKSSKVWVDIAISPGRAGVNDFHVSAVTPQGVPLRLAELTMTVDLPDKKIAPINVPLRDLGPGHYLSPGFYFTLPGSWRVTAHARLDAINEVTLVGTLGIR
ncbi:MAG TPA: copper resistance protein CopC [Acidimicrobiia bacterium]|nr:copper resistance protein CopC [Acidimicrobiia bacterium]